MVYSLNELEYDFLFKPSIYLSVTPLSSVLTFVPFTLCDLWVRPQFFVSSGSIVISSSKVPRISFFRDSISLKFLSFIQNPVFNPSVKSVFVSFNPCLFYLSINLLKPPPSRMFFSS